MIDLFSRQVVGWAIDDHMRASLCVKALQMAFWRRKPPPGLLHHSDRGSQYVSREYRQHLAVMRMEQSMSRKGNCWDNAVAESFFGSLKTRLTHHCTFHSVDEAEQALFDYIEIYYNRQRKHSTNGYRSPAQYELDWWMNFKAA